MASKSSAQNATFRCPLCPRKFTRAFNLRGHVRTHTDERPFVCGVCGRAFTRQHDRRTHEQLHNREMKWICGGPLENEESWGCGRRYDRKSNLSRHHRSKLGRGCIKPTSDGDVADESTGFEERVEIQSPVSGRPPPQPTNAEHSAAIALTDIARTLNISEPSGVPSAQSKITQETALARTNNASTVVDWKYTAAVHKLVNWPSVKILLHPYEYDQDNLMKLERQWKPTYASDLGYTSSPADDTILSTSSLTHDGAAGGGMPSQNGRLKVHAETSFKDSFAEIDHSGTLKMSEKTFRRYYQSYLDRMHKLHPFLDEQELDQKVEAFIKCYFCRHSISTTEANRCHTGIEVTRSLLDGMPSPWHFVERNISNAIILLIFAIGAICDRESPTVNPIMNQVADCQLPRSFSPIRQATLGDSTQAVNDVISPAPLHFAQQATMPLCQPVYTPSKPFEFSAGTSKIGGNGSRQMTDAGLDECRNARNQPFVPGLALYHFATATIGCLLGASNLEYVHASLLASLYAGQYADPFQSHRWISEAARVCQLFVLRESCEDLNDHMKDLCNFAYWSCLQMESDLVAELDIPAGGMSRYEYWVSLPRGRYPMHGPDGLISPSTIMMMYYYSQIHLQKIRIKNQCQKSHLPSMHKAQALNLVRWRNSLPLLLQWKNIDEPAKDINAAFLRDAYYRTKYIIHLPLLYYVLHYGQPSVWEDGVARLAVDSLAGFTPSSETQSYRNHVRIDDMLIAMDYDTSNDSLISPQHWTPPNFDWKDLSPKVQGACKTCVKCAIQGLTAFDGIEDRPVLPNIFGTAHEQFGYMLVLSATYNSSLSELLDRSTLDRLFKRTIRFLLQSENNSPTLRADIRILKEIYLKLFKCPLVPTGA